MAARRPWTPEDQQQAEAMRAEGASYQAIGDALGFSKTTIRYHLNPATAEDHRARARAWRQTNPHAHRQWYEADPEKARARSARWRKANSEKVRKTKRRYAEANFQKVLDYRRRWLDANRERDREKCRRRNAMRRSARRRALLPISLEQLRARFTLFGDRCAYCGASGELTADHVLALKHGGLDDASNIAPACESCNSSKCASPVEEWFRRQPFFSSTRWRQLQRHCRASTAGQLPLGLGERCQEDWQRIGGGRG